MIKVWGRRSSSNVQKVLWALTETGSEFERETVGGSFGGTDTREYRKMNPSGLVPVIKDGTLVLRESNAILRHLARRFGRGTIAPRGRRAMALADMWLDWSVTTLGPPFMVLFFNKIRLPPEKYNAEAVKKAEKDTAEVLKQLNRAIGKKPWLTGKHFNIGDIPPAIVYHRYKNMDVKHAKLPNLDRWYEQLQERPGYREWVMVPMGANVEEWNANEKMLK